MHNVRKLFFNVDKTSKAKKLSGQIGPASALKRKQVPFCPKHYKDWHKGSISKINLKEP